MHTETYYAIRVGDPRSRRHQPYFWTGADGSFPVLFLTRRAAETARGAFGGVVTKAVRVKIKAG